MTAPGPKHINRIIALARAAIAFEQLWAALLWPLLIACVVAAVLFSGLAPRLPDWVRLGLFGLLGLAFLIALKDVAKLRRPSRFDAMRRVEERSALRHRPVTGLGDRLANPGDDGLQQAIWEEHKLRQLQALNGVKAGAPQSRWRQIDRYALRTPVVLAVIAAVFLGQGDFRSNVSAALQTAPAQPAAQLIMDAWLKPPAYTAKPPMLLTSPAMIERLKTEPEILVPENSVLTLRLTNVTAPKLSFHELGEAGTEITGLSPRTTFEKGLFQSETRLTRPVRIKVMDGNADVADWQVALIPDAPPGVAVTELPKGDRSGALVTKWKATDDYGVTGITAELSLADEQDGGVGFEGNGIFLFDAPKVTITLRKANAREEAGTTTSDVAEHPWAGFMVEMALTAKDAANHEATSEIVTFRLPERLFTKPLAKALIEQRRSLILDPDSSGQVEQMLDALILYPSGLAESSGAVLAIATVTSRLRTAENPEDIDAAIGMLWQIAVSIEDGRMSDAKAQLEALRKELQRALAEGAPPERIAELMDKLREAMERYTQSLMDEAQKRAQQGGADQKQPMQQGQQVSPQDLQKMLDMIEKLAESGNTDAAQQLLSELDDILRNLQPGMSAQQSPQQGESPAGKMLDELTDMMRRQQQLMDETQRMQQGEGNSGEPQDGQQPGSGPSPGDLADRQRGLAEQLQQLLDQFGKNGMEQPGALGEAGESMDGAQGSLRQSDRDGALGQQGDALSKLREGAKGLAQQMMQQGQGQQGSEGRHGEARGDNNDPLGRPRAQRGEDYGPDRNMLPSELAIRRAREILDMLRSRAGEQDRPRIERDYIDRLLRGLY